jgi:haloacetate dehalogenase
MRVLVTHSAAGVEISADVRGSGPPVLLLHGYPESRVMWDDVAPALSAGRTTVAADLRGYGASGKPAPAVDGSTYAKRAMAADQVGLMRSLGFERFDVVGHDRGARVAHRMALDHPEAVRSVTVMDVVPTLHMFGHVDRAMASTYFHWFFLALGNGVPQALIGADPATWVASRFAGRCADGGLPIDDERLRAYLAWFATPEAIAATCADYRAAASVDIDLDRADHTAGRRVEAPLLALWGARSYVGTHFDVLAVWREYARGVGGAAIDADHYLPEEAPRDTEAAVLAFLAGNGG